MNARTGKVQRVWKGLTSPTGVAVGRDGTVYVSEVFDGAPEGEPGPGFDPATVGRITKIAPNGKRTNAQVTMPTGLLYEHGKLFSTAWSVASFLGIPHAGQVVKVEDGRLPLSVRAWPAERRLRRGHADPAGSEGIHEQGVVAAHPLGVRQPEVDDVLGEVASSPSSEATIALSTWKATRSWSLSSSEAQCTFAVARPSRSTTAAISSGSVMFSQSRSTSYGEISETT